MENNHLGLLCDIGELNALFAGSDNIEAFLRQIVAMVANHIHADVCSIYLYNENGKELVLKATIGLHQKAINTRLKLGEGIVGFSVERGEAICEKNASLNPHFKLIPGINEEDYESFLVVPILRGIERIGALVIQRKENNAFSENDELALKAITSQLAGAIENARILMDLRVKRKDKVEESQIHDYKFYRVETASEGIVYAKAIVIDKGKPYRSLKEKVDDKPYSINQFNQAIRLTEKQLEDLQAQVEKKLTGVASLIFEAHILMLKDTEFTGTMKKKIVKGQSPVTTIFSVTDSYINKFSKSSNAYTREKINDVEDLTRRLISNLVGEDKPDDLVTNWKGRIVIAKELYPSDVLKLSSEKVSGIILVSGGVTSHLSILARSLQIPLVISDNPELLKISDNTNVLINAEIGNIYINPSKEIVEHFEERKKARSKLGKVIQDVKPKTCTIDGTRIRLMANINLLMDLKLASDLKSEGIGLYRTEFPFLIRSNFPTEEEQIVVYSTIVEQMEGKSITMRTLDIGGDKVLSYYDNVKEKNPAMGVRSIRFSMSHKKIFHQQIRAILRAASGSDNLRITFPMISSLDEFLEAKEDVQVCMKALKKENILHYEAPEIGIMVETPSTIQIIDRLAIEADFFCIGTNDFIQFMLAVDRTNVTVSKYYIPHHPSILRSLNKIVSAAKRYGKNVSICGEMAHQEIYIPFLIGIGIRTLSIAPRYMPQVQKAITKLSLSKCEKLVKDVLKKDTIFEAYACLNQDINLCTISE